MTKQCVCEYHELYKGDTLYKESSWEGGYNFDHIRDIKYCPVCGKELPEDDDINYYTKKEQEDDTGSSN